MFMRIYPYFFVGIVFISLIQSCTLWDEAKITITKDYVINPNWDEANNSFDIIRMKFKDSHDSINPNKPADSQLAEKLEEDTSFVYRANVSYNGTNYSERKVYFNRDNGFLWWGDLHNSSSTKKILGELQQNTWYLLAGLSPHRTIYYVYIDSLDNVHRVAKHPSNW